MMALYGPVAADVRSKIADSWLPLIEVDEPAMSGWTVASPALLRRAVLPDGIAEPAVNVNCFVPVFGALVGDAEMLSTPKHEEQMYRPLSLVLVKIRSRRPETALPETVTVNVAVSGEPFAPLVTVTGPAVTVESAVRGVVLVGGKAKVTVGFGLPVIGDGVSKFVPVTLTDTDLPTAALAGVTDAIVGPASMVKAGFRWLSVV